MKFGSCFSGIGGFDLGFEQAGMTAVWQVEIDKAAAGVLARHFPGVPNLGDVRNVNRTTQSTDLICGGFPCQDVSVAGLRKGLAGERSGLWFEFHRIIDELRPRWVVIENVPGLLSSNGGRDFAVILHGLAVSGYGVAYRILDSQYFRVAQRRRRVFIVGSLGSGRAAEVLFERESGSRDFETERQARQVAPTLFASGAGTDRTASAGSESEFCIISPTVTKWAKGTGGPAGDEVQSLVYGYDDKSINADCEVMPTLRTNLRHQFVSVRRLMPVECERLQGFPDGWTAGQSDGARYRQLGNAVTVNVARWIGERIMQL